MRISYTRWETQPDQIVTKRHGFKTFYKYHYRVAPLGSVQVQAILLFYVGMSLLDLSVAYIFSDVESPLE